MSMLAAALLGVVTTLGQRETGFSHMETAAFIVQDDKGNMKAVEWPSTGLPDSAMWVGPIPAGTVAIAHTHPNWLPRPSRVDVATARSVQLPVYVVTKAQVWQTAAGVAFRVR